MKKILVIDDQEFDRDNYLDCLEAAGYEGIAAENGLIGVQKAQLYLPNLIVCDVAMPELDGYGVLTVLRQEAATALIPFIFLTAKQTKADLRQGMVLGADDYLTKPCTAEDLLSAIETRLLKHELWQQRYESHSAPVKPVNPLPQTRQSTIKTQLILPTLDHCSPQVQALLTQLFEVLETHFHQPIGLPELAQAVGYTPAYLTDLVRRQTGKTLHTWLVERRMQEARHLLRDTDQPVEQIALAVGYEDPSYFSRQFRHYNAMTPKAWRQEHCHLKQI
ncbi:MAG: DNA-binding response regulator [Leptolyngbyaceae cyanobacterium bins.59]|nr:DNA-binding response regulator [Leptolyngbyaceae cyanobacterium bins.59]